MNDPKMTPGRWAVVMLVAAIPLLGFWLYGLFDLDEGFYAAVVAEMNRRGEWVTPYYNGKAWFEKPILLYWAAKPTVALFGDMVGPRLPSILGNLGLYAICGWFLSRRASETAGRIGILAMGSTLFLVGIGRMMLTDSLLVLALAAAFLSFYESLVGERKWRLLTAFCLGVGVLAKGPVAIILFIPLAVWTYFAEQHLRKAFRGMWLPGTLILAATVCTWYVPAYLANGDVFVQRFLIEQNVGRFTGGDTSHAVSAAFTGQGWGKAAADLLLAPIYYPLIMLLGALPWSVYAIRYWPRKANPSDYPLQRFLVRWIVVVLVFFTISSAKLPHYIAPAMPPLIMLAALGLAQRAPNARLIPYKAIVAIAVCFIAANAGFISWYNAVNQNEAHRIASYVREQVGDVAVYQMPRRDDPKFRTTLHETSLPSLLLYLDNTVLEAESFEDMRKANKPLWIITRYNRIDEEELSAARAAKRRLTEVTPFQTEHYKLYRLE